MDSDGPWARLRDFEQAAAAAERRAGLEPPVRRAGPRERDDCAGLSEEPSRKAPRIRITTEKLLATDGSTVGPLQSAQTLNGSVVPPRAWTAEDLWAAALAHTAPPVVHGSVHGAEEPWRSFAEAALRRSAPRALDADFGGLGGQVASVRLSAGAVHLLRQWVTSWLEGLLLELHSLSLHRVGLHGDVGTALSGGGSIRRCVLVGQDAEGQQVSQQTRDLRAEVAVRDRLERAQRLRRIEPADVRSLLHGPLACAGALHALRAARCAVGWTALRRQLLEAVDEEELRY